MKFKQHLDIGKRLYESIDSETRKKFGLIRGIYLIGNVAPDINCVYPAHRIKTTEHRFYRHLNQINSIDLAVVKSFMLGVLTHYICDYFCYAHNNKSLGVKHKIYEQNLYDLYEAHYNEMYQDNKILDISWFRNKKKSVEDNIKDNTMTSKNQSDLILEQLKLMIEDYCNRSDINKNKGWELSREQMQLDLEYALFVAQHILGLIMDPVDCMRV